MNANFRKYLLGATEASDGEEVEMIQSLWSGYGKISRFNLKGSTSNTVIVKHISLDGSTGHPRGWNTDLSHQRKVRSYQVETNWYEHWNQQCYLACRTAKFLGAYNEGSEQWIILEDLNAHYPVRKHQLTLEEVQSCLKWLAHFHSKFLGKEPKGLWNIGTYWHLDTRPEEFEKIEHQALKQNAHRLDELLNGCNYKTIVHGDAKLANFCFSESGEVAAVDFQYVGGGCGMKDVAYFLGSCLSSDDCEVHNEELLNFYFSELEKALVNTSVDIDFKQLEQEWRTMFPIAWTDFTRFLLGWMPSHQKVNGYSLKLMEEVLAGL